ncbi:hypothetical protein [Campylobacter concisus]|jgi:hypothetical protein|uniref:hypothetical protein n=4 Tax=Campylobacter concisus TaxID=199 RepID=UPI000CD93C6F|nr:hypothetical protein [Campylobacter concisus]
MKKIISKYYISVIEFFIFVFGIVLTLVVEGKFEDYIPYTKKHPLNSIVIVVIILLALFVVKIMHEIKKYNAEEELLKASKENTFWQNLISNFKYQISKPLEDELCKVFKELKLDSQYRITVYTHTSDIFFSIGRYSENPSFKKFGRIAISDKNELIFRAWEQQGELIEKVKPNKTLMMKSVKIAVKFLYEKNEESPKKDRFGIVVFETTKNKDNKIVPNNLEKATKIIQKYFDSNWNIKQDLNFATEEGF